VSDRTCLKCGYVSSRIPGYVIMQKTTSGERVVVGCEAVTIQRYVQFKPCHIKFAGFETVLAVGMGKHLAVGRYCLDCWTTFLSVEIIKMLLKEQKCGL